jgi:hypothetical protein
MHGARAGGPRPRLPAGYVADSEAAGALAARAQERREQDLADVEKRVPAVQAALRAGARADTQVAVRHFYSFACVLVGAATPNHVLFRAARSVLAAAFEDCARGVRTRTFKDAFIAASKRRWTVPDFVQERLSVVGQSWGAVDRALDAAWCEHLSEEDEEDDGAEADEEADEEADDPDVDVP